MSKDAIDPIFSIPSFYSGRSVFITGASGFFGKALIEKLLRSCPNIKELFLLLRPKADKNINERLHEILRNPLFDTLRREQPHCFDKLTLIEGDFVAEDLGLSTSDRDTLLEKTSVIFHVGANVKFDNSLQDSVFTNVRSTRDVCILAEQMKNLVALVHVSTAFAQCDKLVIDEIVYPTEVSWEKMIQIAEKLDEDVLEVFKLKYIGVMPNSYTFTKKLAEQVIADYSGSLPCIICRPSVVTGTLKEPMKGWIDNFNSPLALYFGVGKGVLKVVYTDKDTSDNFMPVDIAIKALIVAAWRLGSRKPDVRSNLPVVYNCTEDKKTTVRHMTLLAFAMAALEEIPLEGIIWPPGAIVVSNQFLFRLLVILLHVIPGFVIDGLLRLSGKQPRLLKLYRKILALNQAIGYFITNEWEYKNEKLLSLFSDVPVDNQQAFGYANNLAHSYDKISYLKDCLIGGKIYFLNESMDRMEATRAHYNRVIWIYRVVKAIIGVFLIWLIYKCYVKNMIFDVRNN